MSASAARLAAVTARIRVVGLGGSMAARSTSLAALDRALDAARATGASIERLALADLDLPMYRPGLAPTAAVTRLCDAVDGCHAMLWSSPLYHGSISGSFKNALDWLEARGEPYLDGKLVGLIATADGVQALQAINAMEVVVRALRGLTMPLTVPIAGGADLNARLDRLGELTVTAARRFMVGAALEG